MSKFYSLDTIETYEARYNLIYGERSNGKTFAVLDKILQNWVFKGEKGAYIRRYVDDIKTDKMRVVWSAIANENKLVEKYTKGEWTHVVFQSREWYLAKYNSKLDKYIKQKEPFCTAFAISSAEHYKSTAYPEITTILFDEFITRQRYIMNEFVEFNNILSTIIRHRDNVKIYMLGNSVNKYNPYFDEMGLNKADTMKPGDIQLYTIETKKEDLKIAVQYCLPNSEGKESDVYFAFDNPKLSMITDGDWEMPMYPHAPFKINPRDIVEVFFIDFRGELLQGDIVAKDDNMFIFIHEKTTPLKDDVKMLYTPNPSPKINHAQSLTGPAYRNPVSARIGHLIKEGQIYYQDNNVGELVRNYQNLTARSETDIY